MVGTTTLPAPVADMSHLPRSYRPFSHVALAIAPAVVIPDSLLLSLRRADLVVRHRSSALLFEWRPVLWNWNNSLSALLAAWFEQRHECDFFFVLREEGLNPVIDVRGSWHDNPFELAYLGDLHVIPNGEPIDLGKLAVRPERIERRFVSGRLEVKPVERRRTRQPLSHC